MGSASGPAEKTDGKSETGGGTGGGGGIRPIGAIIFDKSGARVEAVKGAVSNLAEVIGATAGRMIDERTTHKAGPAEEK